MIEPSTILKRKTESLIIILNIIKKRIEENNVPYDLLDIFIINHDMIIEELGKRGVEV